MDTPKSRTVLLLAFSLIWLSPGLAGEPIYRWVSPTGVVSFGDHPPPAARDLRRIHTLPAPPPGPSADSAATVSSNEARTLSATNSALAREEALIARINLLTALANYAHSNEAPTHPPHSVYSPAFLLPPGYAYPSLGPTPGAPPPPPGPGPGAQRPGIPPWASPPPSAGPPAPQRPLWAAP
ncbi:DUF4124 domain-containing protein [Acidithiobacillus sp.]|uniref:DUF4124 domain-containing protein n=1 Tax=Acidithiobacillus sp. TaxID=1872118 RepID=UPI0025B8CB34|nr:DUF4124 domain-containing protein [Acidithiobacillus sp.]